MGLATLYNPPFDERSWDAWSFANDSDHKNIISAIQRQTGHILTVFSLDPITVWDLQAWLLRHQAMHNAMNAVSGVQGSDFTFVDFENPESVSSFVGLHANEHRLNEQTFGVK